MKSALNEITSSFVAFQREAEERMLAFEERRMAIDRETDDRHRREDREHELVMYRLLAGMQSEQATPAAPPVQVDWAVQHAPTTSSNSHADVNTPNSYFHL